MSSTDPARRPLAVAMVAAPLLWVAAELVSPKLKSDAAEQLAAIAGDTDRWYAYTALLVLGTIVFVPAVLGLMRLSRVGAPRLTTVGGVVLGFGTVIAAGDAMSQLVTWQMVATGADRGQMAALLDRFDNATGAQLFFGPGGLAFLVGSVLLTAALVRTRAIPVWASVAFLVGMIGQLAGFVASSIPVIAISNVVVLISLCVAAVRLWRSADEPAALPAGERPFVPAI